MKSISWLIVFFSLGLVGAGIYFYHSSNRQTSTIISPLAEKSQEPEPEFSVAIAPSETLRGTIASMDGEIKWQGRTATEAGQLDSPVTIQQGEKLITGENSQLSLVFNRAASVDMAGLTELEIIQTLPEHLVFSQISGTAGFTQTGKFPVAVRTKHLLAETSGKMIIALDPESPIISLKVKSGQSTVAYNDPDFVSQVLTLNTGKTLTFNDDTRQAVVK